ncbi:CASP-like protein 4A3 isoform X2 [Ziziphus jujuba]|uniref:CASP-like protein n=1 Tax=Ziziphus jujuba TaxID=326968 RepID=A0A6P3ZPG5_ZIZJJ|nr:CASP-like protein 4A3 isoform X2 [Ziziphus jujuba]
MNKSASKNSESSAHSRHSSLSPHNYHSPLRSEAGDPHEATPYASPENSPQKTVDNSRAIVTTNATNTEKYTQYSPLRPNMQDNNNNNNNNSNNYNNYRKTVENASAMPEKSPSPVVVLNRSTSMELPSSVTKVGPATSVIGGGDGGGGGGRSRYQQGRRPQNEDVMKSAALGFRVSEFVLCLISFSVMAADKTQGWSGDSFDRYKEYRYCLSVNVIACVYSAFQAYDLVYHLVYGKHLIRHHLRHHFEFSLDQILAYLLISASSSAATRVDDWQSNWGKDEFTQMASASVGMSFLAFVAFAISSLISGYNLWNPNSV